MNEPKLDVAQLQKRDPAAWSALLQNRWGVDDVVVTAVTAKPLFTFPHINYLHPVSRYILALADHSDPITLIGKRTNRTETLFYRHTTPQIPSLTPHCWFTHLSDDGGWIVIDDVPNHHPPLNWQGIDVENAIYDLVTLHTIFWNQQNKLHDNGLHHFIGQKRYTLPELQIEHEFYFDEGPGEIISEHAINNAGRLAPTLLKAANGLAVIRDLGGWPGILGESHLRAAADLLDDPVPMLAPLRRLPPTLLHGNPYTYHWHMTLFDDQRLFDWQKAIIAPGICDLVSFIEQFGMLYDDDSHWGIHVRQEWPLSEETMIDSYLLAMSGQIGTQFNARDVRLAIPAARCLYVLTTWLPHFAKWFSDMPNKFTWQKVNRMSDEQLKGTVFQPIVGFRPYLTAVFQRFLQAYRML